MSKTDDTTQTTLGTTRCDECGEQVDMNRTPQSNRRYCPLCGPIQSQWESYEKYAEFR